MSDLDDEELKATRKLHGLNDDLFKEGTDINAGNINKIMERLNFLIIDLKSTKKVNEIITEEGKLNLAKDIAIVLNMLKDKEIGKLKEYIDYQILCDFLINSVSDEEEPIWTEKHIEELLENFEMRWKDAHK